MPETHDVENGPEDGVDPPEGPGAARSSGLGSGVSFLHTAVLALGIGLVFVWLVIGGAAARLTGTYTVMTKGGVIAVIVAAAYDNLVFPDDDFGTGDLIIVLGVSALLTGVTS